MQTIFQQIAIDDLQKGQYQPREDMPGEALTELAESIRQQGLIEPLVIREITPGKYEIIAGERRWRAARMAGLSEVPCLIGAWSDAQACAMTLVENIQRQDLNPIEEAQGYRRLMHDFHFLQEDIAAMVGKSRSHIANLLRLLTLEEPVKQALIRREFSPGHARVLIGLPHREQIFFLQKSLEEGWSVRHLEQVIKKHKEIPQPIMMQKDRDVERLQRLLSEQLGAPVQIMEDVDKGGWLKVKFFDNDTLAGLLARLGLQEAAED